MPAYRAASGSAAEDLFIDLFSDTFGEEKAGHLYSQYPFYDIYQNSAHGGNRFPPYRRWYYRLLCARRHDLTDGVRAASRLLDMKKNTG
jgi:hypothetical protein